MSRINQDPETYFTKDKIPYMPKIGGVEERIEGRVGFHEFELCLLRTHWMSERYLNGQPNIDRIDLLNHLRGLKADIMRYCLPHELDWKKLISEKRAYLVVTPNHDSHMYYRLMANNLLILDETQVTRFLDFHLVNAVLKFKVLREHGAKFIDEAYIRFLQELDYQVIFMMKNDVPIVRSDVIHQIQSWVRNKMDAFTDNQLVSFHKYEFDVEKTNMQSHPYEEISQAPLLTGCPYGIIKAYFMLLTKSNFELKGNLPFVDIAKVNYILYKWFGIGEEIKPDLGLTLTINRKQLLFHLYQFKKYFCKSRKKGSIQNEDIIRLAMEEFSELFEGISFKSQLDNFKRDATNGKHRSLDFKEYSDLKKSQAELKKP